MKNSSLFSFNPKQVSKKVFYFLLKVEISIISMDVFLNYIPHKQNWKWAQLIRRSFNITREDSIANWFSATQTFSIAIILFLLSYQSSRDKKNRSKTRAWGLISLFFGFLAFDDATKFHERVGSTMKRLVGHLIDSPSYYWQLFVAPFFAIIGIIMLYFLIRELKSWKRLRSILIGFLCLSFAIGIDFIEGMKIPSLLSYEVRHFSKLLEEFLEMLGMTFFLVTFLQLLLERISHITFKNDDQI